MRWATEPHFWNTRFCLRRCRPYILPKGKTFEPKIVQAEKKKKKNPERTQRGKAAERVDVTCLLDVSLREIVNKLALARHGDQRTRTCVPQLLIQFTFMIYCHTTTGADIQKFYSTEASKFRLLSRESVTEFYRPAEGPKRRLWARHLRHLYG